MFEPLVVALGTLLAPPQVAQAAEVAPAEAFQKGLAAVRELVQRGAFDKADQQLKELLVWHEETDYARLRQADIVELARRCAFQLSREVPKLADLVSGELVRWDAKSGDLEIRYVPGRFKDFETPEPEDRAYRVHPAAFVDSYTVQFDCPVGCSSREGPTLYVGVGTDELFQVSFGTTGEESDSYYPAQIARLKKGKGDVVDSQDKPAPPSKKKFELKVVVGAGAVTAFRDGKRILQAKRSLRDGGCFAFDDDFRFDALTLKGKVQPGWAQGLLDSATQEALKRFDARWKPEERLPAWLFEGMKGMNPAAPAAADEDAQARYDARREELGKREDALTLAELEAEVKKLTVEFPRIGDAWSELATLQLWQSNPDAAQSTCDAALAAGVPVKELDPLPRMLAQIRSGPAWARTFAFESAHYVVKSDISRELCIEASKRLEESYRSYVQRLAPVPDAEKKRFVVFLFSGEAGYQQYVNGAMEGGGQDTAGLYSPTLKQLVIWNLPDREEMFLTIRHEGFHQYLDRLAEDPPLWFNEGMAEYFSLADLYGGEWKEGQVEADHVAMLKDRSTGWVPLKSLFTMDDEAFQGEGVEKHYAESWAVIHYLRQGPKEMQDAFKRLWAAVLADKSREETVKDAFGSLDLAALEESVKAHVRKLGG
jgi:hypothetical protein